MQKNKTKHEKLAIKGILATIAPWVVILALIYIAFFTHPGSLGQIVQPSPIATVDHFYGATKVGNNTLWLVGNFGKIVQSKDGGKNWTTQSAPTQDTLQAIAAWNDSQAVAVGDQSTVLVTKDGGAHWSKAKLVPHTKSFNKLISVRILPDGHAWAVGQSGAILRSENRGTRWERMRKVQDILYHDVYGVGDEIWVVGEFGTVLHSENNGQTWQKESTGTKSTLEAVHFRDPRHGVVVGLDGVILTTNDGGQTWQQDQLPDSDHLFSVAWNGHQWLATGANGLVVSAGASAPHWKVSRLGSRNFSWHTAVLPIGSKWLLVGSSVGLFSNGTWQRITSDKRSRPRA